MAFSSATLAAALQDDVEAVEDPCEALAHREQFIRGAGAEEWPDGTVAASCRFLHVLYEHVLYERVPVARRANLHRRIGEREEAGFRARLGQRAAALPLHFERSRDAPRAVRYRHQAAEQALQRAAYTEAIEIARRRAERSLELRAAVNLAQLLAHEGRHREASRTLGKIYAGFTEGFDTADLRAARSLLDRLQTAT